MFGQAKASFLVSNPREQRICTIAEVFRVLKSRIFRARSGQKRLMFLRLFPRNEEYRSGSDVPRGMRVGTLHQNREEVQSDRMHDMEDIGRRDLPIAPENLCS